MQLLGVASVAAFTFITSLVVWKVIDLTIGMRVSRDVEYVGQDVGELGIESHPEFVLVPEDFDDYREPLDSRSRRGRRSRRPRDRNEPPMDPRLRVPPGGWPPGTSAPHPGAVPPPGTPAGAPQPGPPGTGAPHPGAGPPGTSAPPSDRRG